jgi:hypothetical protein
MTNFFSSYATQKIRPKSEVTPKMLNSINFSSSRSSNPHLAKEAFQSKSKIIEPSSAKKELINTILKGVLYNSFAQAIIKIIQTPHVTLKIFLILFVLASTSLASYLVVSSILSYFTFDVSTTSRTIYETPTLFPKVTFCNVNWFATEFAYNLTQKAIKFSQVMHLPSDQKKKLGHSLSDILVKCFFNSHPCYPTDFTWSFDVNYGNCFTFNSGFDSSGNVSDLRRTFIAGHDLGLQLTFYVNIYEKLLNNTDNTFGLGGVVRIGNSSYLTDYLDGGLFVPPGSSTYITVDREFKTILAKPYSNCEIVSNLGANSDLYTLISQSDFAYTQQLCFSQCLQRQFIRKYNCTLFIFVSLFNASLCDYDLYLNILYTDNIFSGSFFNEICLPSCPLECDRNVFKSSISSYHLIGDHFLANITNNSRLALDFVHRKIDSRTARYSFTQVSVYYESLSYTLSTESPQMDLVSLLASIGGNLGLFLGVNVFSLGELVEVVIEVLFILVNLKRGNRPNNN